MCPDMADACKGVEPPERTPVRSTELLDRSGLIAILEQHLSVTDEWGGCKLASWKFGHAVAVAGIDATADAILARLSNAKLTQPRPE